MQRTSEHLQVTLASAGAPYLCTTSSVCGTQGRWNALSVADRAMKRHDDDNDDHDEIQFFFKGQGSQGPMHGAHTLIFGQGSHGAHGAHIPKNTYFVYSFS